MEDNITFVTAFMAGVVSFLSPCVLPMVPTYTAFLAGTKVNESSSNQWSLLVNATFFLSGFTVIFVALGATASYFGQFLFEYQNVIRKVGAVFMLVMGIQLVGIISVPLLQREYRPFFHTIIQGPFGAFMLGMAFTFGWTPCIGPILSSILVYASTTATLGQGALLLFIYAMGFSIPFMVLAFLLNRYLTQVRTLYKWLPLLQKIAGVILILVGVVIYFDVMQRILGLIWDF